MVRSQQFSAAADDPLDQVPVRANEMDRVHRAVTAAARESDGKATRRPTHPALLYENQNTGPSSRTRAAALGSTARQCAG